MYVILGFGIAIAAGLIVLATIPVSHGFSDEFNATSRFGGATLVAPTGSHIAMNWSATGGPASFSVYDGHAQLLFASHAATGSFAFTSTTPSDDVEANSTGDAYVYLSWSYAAPLL
jgi:hypothetical protein